MASNIGVVRGLGKRKGKKPSPRVKEAKRVVNRVVNALKKVNQLGYDYTSHQFTLSLLL